jgi:methylmalonyl-CoA/ethylmalonyl-CoA epimerase
MTELPNMPDGYAFHHIGYATTSIERERSLFMFLGYMPEGEPFADPAQGVAGCFMTGHGPRIELLENLPGEHTLTPWLDAGVRMYHLGYEVDNVIAAIEWARQQRAKVVTPPVPAVAFGGRRIAFVIFRHGLLLEFIERHGS